MGHRGDIVKRTILSLMVFIGLLFSSFAGASAQPLQDDQTYTPQITDDVVDLGDSGEVTWVLENFDFHRSAQFREEYIWFTYNHSNFQMIFIEGPNDTLGYHDLTLQNMEPFYDSFELLDEEIAEEYSWFVGLAELDDRTIVVYYEFHLDVLGQVDLALMQFTTPSAFQGDLEFVQGEVTVGGDPLLPGTDAAALAVIVDQSGEISTDSSTDATAAPQSDEQSTTDRNRSSRGGSDTTGEDEEGETSSRSRSSRTGTQGEKSDDVTESTGDATTDRESRTSRLGEVFNQGSGPDDSTPVVGDNWQDMGLISDTEWESVTFGNVVTWDAATWEFPPDYEYAIVVNEDPPYDILTLQTTNELGYVYVTIDLEYETTPRNLIEYWVSPEYHQLISGEVNVMETATTATSAAMVYESSTPEGEPIIVVLEATFRGDGKIVFSQITAGPDDIHIVYEQYLNGVQVDGESFDMTFTVEDIRDISGN